jgi:exopolysaccharide biosynthesis protein
MVLTNGQNNGIPSVSGTDGEGIAGRTSVGLSSDGTCLFLLTIDGLEGATPQYGATFYDVGEWLLRVGAYNGITLDGGGSTAMAMMNARHEAVLVNVPHDVEGANGPPYLQRANAQFLGVIPGS